MPSPRCYLGTQMTIMNVLCVQNNSLGVTTTKTGQEKTWNPLSLSAPVNLSLHFAPHKYYLPMWWPKGGSRGRVQGGGECTPLRWSFLLRIYIFAFKIFLPHRQWRHAFIRDAPLLRKILDLPLWPVWKSEGKHEQRPLLTSAHGWWVYPV